MIGFKHARQVNSFLDLNGPALSFTTQPVTGITSQADGNMSFSGAATASFPVGQTERATNTGSLAFQWYKNGVALSDGANVTGSTTTSLSLSGLTFVDNNAKVYLESDYVPSAYGSGLTANAYNEPHNSDEVTISVQPLLLISEQPVSATVSANVSTTFDVVVITEDGLNDDLTFDWRVDGVSIDTLDYLPSITRSVSNIDTFDVDPRFPTGERVSARRSTLTILSNSVAFHKIDCVISHPNCNPGSITSDEVNLDVTVARALINFERYNAALADLADSGQRDLVNSGLLVFRADPNSQSRAITIYPPEADITVKITMGGGAGANRGSRSGGEGGLSVFKVTMKKNEEYQLKLGVNDTQGGGPRGGNNGGGGASILYHKARVIAALGGGGGAGSNGDGGDGGGIQVPGENGSGSSSGAGGAIFSQGGLPTEGFFPTDLFVGTSGGRLSGCTIGKFYRDRGFSPCQDVGIEPYRYADGRTFSGSAFIQRGYKSGIGHRNNGGNASGNEGGGGSGAAGGAAANSSGSGGGGASGYAAGEIELLTSTVLQTGTRLGGNDGVGFISIELFTEPTFDDPDPYVPLIPPRVVEVETFSVGREAAFSNTVTFTKQSGTGPSTLTFGPNGGSLTAQISSGSVYKRTSSSSSGGGGLSFRVSGNTLQMEDAGDNDFNDLTVTPTRGTFTDTSTLVY